MLYSLWTLWCGIYINSYLLPCINTVERHYVLRKYRIYISKIMRNEILQLIAARVFFSFFLFPTLSQLRNEVLPLQLSVVQHLESFHLIEDNRQTLSLIPETLNHQRLKQKLLVSSLCGRKRKDSLFLFLCLLQTLSFWSMNDFSSSCWYTSKMSHSFFYLWSSPLRLTGVK